MLDERAYDEIVGLVYDSAVEPLRLKQALASIVETVSATGAHLVGVEKSSQQVVLSAITGFSPLGEIDYNERYAKLDPRAPIMLGAPAGHWKSCHEYLDQAFVDRSEFFQDFLIPHGSRYMSAVKLLESDAHSVIVGFHRSITQSPLSRNALSFLQRITPHLQRAVRLIQEQSHLQSQWAVVKATLDMLDYGAFVCDESGELLVGNESAAATLEQGDGLALKDGRISIRDTEARSRLRSILLGECSENAPGANGAAVTGALLVPRPSGMQPYQLILRKIDRERTLLGFANDSLWSVMISDPARTSVPTMRAISVLYDLTPAESRLANLLIAGATPDEIAAQTRVKISTIRSQLHSLFAKTGTPRQAELVRLFSSVPALREPRHTVEL